MESIRGERLQTLLQTILQCRTPDEASQFLKREAKDGAEICFDAVDWEQLRSDIGQRDLKFPFIGWGTRTLHFGKCDFGDGDITFAGTFQGAVVFQDAHFGSGTLSFAGSSFDVFKFKGGSFSGQGKVLFNGARFYNYAEIQIQDLGEKRLSFGPFKKPGQADSCCVMQGPKFHFQIKASTGTSISFREAILNVGDLLLDFAGASNLSQVDFTKTEWRSGNVCMNGLRLGFPDHEGTKNYLRFTDANFEEVRRLRFDGLGMVSGHMIFAFTRFPERAITELNFSDLGPGEVVFKQAHFPGILEFSQKDGEVFTSELSFRGSTFKGPLFINGLKFGPVPNLVGTEFQKHLSLTDVEFGSQMTSKQKRQEPNRGAKLQRIKELAEANKDHALALTCHAEEMRFNRFQRKGVGRFLADTLDLIYECTSNYGQSIALPMLWLIFTWAGFGLIYRYVFDSIESPLLFSFAWTLPFLPAAGILRLIGFRNIFEDAEPVLYALMATQGLIAIALIFLIGLGFRNRFRI